MTPWHQPKPCSPALTSPTAPETHSTQPTSSSTTTESTQSPHRPTPHNRPVVDLTGLVLAPGFIDVHSHADNSPLLPYDDTSKILQGVTTEVTGNCGFSLAPHVPEYTRAFCASLHRLGCFGCFLWWFNFN